ASDRKAALEELHHTFELLAEVAAGDNAAWNYHSPPVLGAWFLSVAELIEPDDLDAWFWRALSLRLPLARQSKVEVQNIDTRAFVAMLLSRYDRQTARAIYGDLAEEARKN